MPQSRGAKHNTQLQAALRAHGLPLSEALNVDNILGREVAIDDYDGAAKIRSRELATKGTGSRKQDPKYGDWSGTRRSMSYGVMPKRDEFKKAFKEEIDGAYEIRNDSLVGDEDFSEPELWKLLTKLAKKSHDEEHGSLASVILETLGFEWV
jgi:hypothetical protein